jgi:peptidoglycan/xylan/chitin deacetylase (PgdA/CDA1 family)
MPKTAVRALLASPPLLRLWRGLPGTHLSIFTLHRFAVADLGIEGHDPGELAATLSALRRERIPLLPLGSVVEALRDGTPLPRRAAVFTVDDGYFDFAEVGAPIFAQFDCPVTVFLITGFLDGSCWLWWDKVRYLFLHGTPAPAVPLLGRDGPPPTPARIGALARDISHRLTRTPHTELMALISFLAERAEVTIPETPPPEFSPMTWKAARGLAAHGVTFGPHTVTHPVLDRTSEEHARQEITESWLRIREVLEAPLPVFSYPNGGFGAREAAMVRAAGLQAAVATTPRYLTVDGSLREGDWLFRLPRFPYPDLTRALLLTSAGFRRLPRLSRRRTPV